MDSKAYRNYLDKDYNDAVKVTSLRQYPTDNNNKESNWEAPKLFPDIKPQSKVFFFGAKRTFTSEEQESMKWELGQPKMKFWV